MSKSFKSTPSPSMIVALIALFVALGGTAVALDGSNTVFTDDIVNGEVKVADIGQGAVASDEIANGQVKAADLGDGEVKAAEIANGQVKTAEIGTGEVRGSNVLDETLSGADVAANSLKGADIDESTLAIGPSSGDFVHGRGTLLSNRIVLVPGDPEKTLFVIPGLGELTAHCFSDAAEIEVKNTTNSTIDRWIELDGKWYASLVPPGSNLIITTATIPAMTVALGVGNDPGARRIATLDAFAFRSGEGAPCGFQAQGTLWTSG